MRNGWALDEEEDRDYDDGTRKMTFWLIDPSGVRHMLDVSPYERFVPAEIADMMIDMGVPQRGDFGINYPISFDMIRARHRMWEMLTKDVAA